MRERDYGGLRLRGLSGQRRRDDEKTWRHRRLRQRCLQQVDIPSNLYELVSLNEMYPMIIVNWNIAFAWHWRWWESLGGNIQIHVEGSEEGAWQPRQSVPLLYLPLRAKHSHSGPHTYRCIYTYTIQCMYWIHKSTDTEKNTANTHKYTYFLATILHVEENTE